MSNNTQKEFSDLRNESNEEIVFHKPNDEIVLHTPSFVKVEIKDNINNPSHYTQTEEETIETVRKSMNYEEYTGYLKGNIYKYLDRYKYKDKPEEDLLKAEWYLKRLINFIKERNV